MPTQNTINWNPPELLYSYSGDLYCPDCASDIEHGLIGQGMALCQGMNDSNSWPVPYPRGVGECDTPDHCGKCQRFLGRNLTDDGIAYVKEQVRDLALMAGHGVIVFREIVKGWCDFYGIDVGFRWHLELDGHYSGPHHPTQWCNTMCPDCESLWVSKMEIDLDI